MKTMAEIVEEMQGGGTAADLAKRSGLSQATLCRIKGGTRQQTPETSVIAALLRAAEPPQQIAIFQVLGIEDVEQFARALLAAAGVADVAVTGTVGNRDKREKVNDT